MNAPLTNNLLKVLIRPVSDPPIKQMKTKIAREKGTNDLIEKHNHTRYNFSTIPFLILSDCSNRKHVKE